MQLHQLHAFLAVAHDLSFRRAAERLCLSQPALSAQIAELERHLGVRLFERDRSGTRLTDDGRVLVPVARSAVAAVAEVELAARRSPRHRRRFAVGLVARGVGELTWPILSTFHEARPDLDLALVHMGFSDVLPSLRSGAIDVLLSTGPFGEEDGTVLTVGTVPVGVVMPAHHPQAEAETVEISWAADRVRLRPPTGMGRTFNEFWTLQDVGAPELERLEVPRAGQRGVDALLRRIEQGVVNPWPAQVPVTPAHTLRPLDVDRPAPLQVVARHRPDPDVRELCRVATTLSGS